MILLQNLPQNLEGVAASVAEVRQGEIVRGDLPSGEMKDLINHWVEVIDEWVARLDQGMGGTAQNGADPTEAGEPADPLPGPPRDTVPAPGTG